MAFITVADLFTQIKDKELETLLEDSNGRPHELRITFASAAQEISSYICHAYDMVLSMPNVAVFDPSEPVNTGDIVIAFAAEWSASASYALGDLVEFKDFIYRANAPVSAGVTPDSSSLWEITGKSGDFYTSNVNNNTSLLTDLVSWVKLPEDPRNALLVKYMVDISLYDLHSRIKPRQIPEHRIARRDDAITFLKMVADPRKNMKLDLPRIDHGEKSGTDLTWGSGSKQSHNF